MQSDHDSTVDAECAELVRIPVLDVPSYEAAASLLAVLAHPEDKKARGRFERAAYLKIVEHLSKDAEWRSSNQWLRPDFLLQDKKFVDREYKRGIRIIQQSRMIAAKMAAPMDCWLVALVNGRHSEGAGGEVAKEYGYLPPTSLEWVAEVSMDLDRLRERDTAANKGNITARCWTPSMPVLHLCLALQVIFNAGDEMSYLDLPVEALFNDPGLIMTVINQARFYRNFTAHVFDIPPSQQIDLDWR